MKGKESHYIALMLGVRAGGNMIREAAKHGAVQLGRPSHYEERLEEKR
jgi:hypothetical protein